MDPVKVQISSGSSSQLNVMLAPAGSPRPSIVVSSFTGSSIADQTKVQMPPSSAPQINVAVSPVGSLQQTATSGITLKNFAGSTTRLDQLQDVIEPADAPEGSALVYHPDTDKYVVQAINLDGGTF